MKTYRYDDLEFKLNGADLKAIEISEIDIPGFQITCNGKPLYPCKYFRNSDVIEIVSFDDGESYHCSYQNYDQIYKLRTKEAVGK